MGLIEKNIPLSEYEKQALAKQSSSVFFLKLPLPLMRWLVLKNIESYRKPKDFVMPIIPECENEIEVFSHELQGYPNPVKITVYARKEDNNDKKPLFYFIHGGGFMGGNSIVNEGLMRLIADKTGSIAVAVDYNVAPEVKHPVPLNECHEVLNYILENYPVDKTKIIICGDSAGGNLTAVLTLKLLNENGPVPRGQIILYPVCDLSNFDRASYLQKGTTYSGMRKGMMIARSVYLPDEKSQTSIYVSPMLTDFKEPQPDALLLVAECDALRCDGLDYGEKLEVAGGYARTILYKGAYHAFINDLRRSDIADDAAEEILTFVNDRI